MSPYSSKSGWIFSVNSRISRPIPTRGDSGRLAGLFGLKDGEVETLYDDFKLEISPKQIIAVTGPS